MNSLETLVQTSQRDIRTNNLDRLYSPEGWKLCTEQQLRGHIVKQHFQARNLALVGIPRYDLEVAKYRGFNLNSVVHKAYELLERSDKDIQQETRNIPETLNDEEIPHYVQYVAHNDGPFTIEQYHIKLVKTLRYIENLNLAPINWQRVAKSVPNYKTIHLNLERDSNDQPFSIY